MGDDDYSEDRTELATPYVDDATELVDQIQVDKIRGPSEDVTNPVQAVPPDDLRRKYLDDLADKTIERDPVDPRKLGLDPPPKPTGDRPNLPKSPAGNSLRGRRKRTASGLQPKPNRADPRTLAKKPPKPEASQPGPPAGAPRADAPKLKPRPDTQEQLRRLGLTRNKRANANNVRPNSGFYSLPEANSDGFEPTLDGTIIQDVPRFAETRELLALIAALVSGLLCGGAILAYALTRWAHPTTIMAWTLLAMVVCAGIIGGLVVPRDVELKVSGLRSAFLPMGISSALILIVALAWQIDVIRTALRPLAPAMPEVSRRVLDDRSEQVALAECVNVAHRYDTRRWREMLLDSLAGRPELTSKCLAAIDPEVASALHTALSRGWYSQLLKGGIDEERACAVSDSVASLEHPPGVVESRLLTCVLEGDSTVQLCCGVALARKAALSPDWVEDFELQEGTSDARAVSGLVALAFHRHDISDTQVEIANTVGFTGVPAERLALSMACEAVRDDTSKIAKHLRASLEGHCPLELGQVPDSRELWVAACEEVQEGLQKKNPETLDVLCGAVTRATMRLAVDAASRTVSHGAADRLEARQMADAIQTDVAEPGEIAAEQEIDDPIERWKAYMAKRRSDWKAYEGSER